MVLGDVVDKSEELGRLTWHCSEDDSGPDVGLSLGLGNGKLLWVGEITRAAYTEVSRVELGKPGGWWLISYDPDPRVLGKFIDAESARDFIEQASATLNQFREELRAAAISFERISLARSARDKTITAGEALVRIRRFLGE